MNTAQPWVPKLIWHRAPPFPRDIRELPGCSMRALTSRLPSHRSSSGPLKSEGPQAQPQAPLLHLPSCWEECLWPPAFQRELKVPTGHTAHPLCPLTHDSDDHPCPWHLRPKEAKTDS